MYGHRNVFTVSLALATLAVLSLGCKTGAASAPPTPDIQAMIAKAVVELTPQPTVDARATADAQARIVEAKVKATLAAMPTEIPTSTPMPTPAPSPTPTPAPTITPSPTPTLTPEPTAISLSQSDPAAFEIETYKLSEVIDKYMVVTDKCFDPIYDGDRPLPDDIAKEIVTETIVAFNKTLTKHFTQMTYQELLDLQDTLTQMVFDLPLICLPTDWTPDWTTPQQ